jgi:hypothetical protein
MNIISTLILRQMEYTCGVSYCIAAPSVGKIDSKCCDARTLPWNVILLLGHSQSFVWVSFVLNRLPHSYFDDMAMYLRRKRKDEFHLT